MKLSTNHNFVFFGALGWAFAGVACSASPVSTAPGVGGSVNSGVGGGGNGYNASAGTGSPGGAGNDVLQPDGSLKLMGTIRDFHANYPDMEPCTNSSGKLCDSGHVEQNPTLSDQTENCGVGSAYPNSCFIDTQIGSDSKPAYVGPAVGTVTTTGPSNFQWWFNTAPTSDDINMAADVDFSLSPNGDGTFTYQNLAYFPIDSALYGSEGQKDNAGNPRNYGFTTEFHLKFTYKKGQTFYFMGDDDLLVFINNQLVVDRSGIHNAQDATLKLDDMGLTPEADYQFDLFYCERHKTKSELTITTSMEFTRSVAIN
jgi:fibro-slime domain-containing protein